jgi:hypothetical protein
MDDKVTVQNVTSPGHVTRVDRLKYEAMRTAMMAVMSHDAPGLTAAEISAAVKPHLPDASFPGGATAGWWMKCVQLDLEAKGLIARSGKPLRFRLV